MRGGKNLFHQQVWTFKSHLHKNLAKTLENISRFGEPESVEYQTTKDNLIQH